MARKRKKIALYEIISRSKPKVWSSKNLEQSPKDESGKDQSTAGAIEGLTRWPTRPRIVQFNAGRVEISMPYLLVITLFLVFVLLFLVVFRLGQNLSGPKTAETVAKTPGKMFDQAMPKVLETVEVPQEVQVVVKKAEPVKSGGNNRIVIQTLDARKDLEPVEQYFARFGIQTEIRKIGNTYYLVTGEKYENPERSGTDGYRAKQKIIEFGAKYKSPSGYRSFGARPFHDAYGMRFDD